jgi:MFS family permease
VTTRTETSAVYAAGLVQGIVLLTFPAASTIFTSPAHYGLSSTQYGAMFLPQVVTAITASLLGGGLARRFGLKRVFLVGVLADLASMVSLVTSQFFTHTQALAYGLLLAATAMVGVGFGLVVPALNTFTAAFHPDNVDKAVLTLNALLGLGTALAPLFVALFIEVGAWWGLPIMSGALMVGLFIVSARLSLHPAGTRAAPRGAAAPQRQQLQLPMRFWLFALFAVFYGICETINGNWSQALMSHLGASATTASLALTTFWVMVTVGRVLFSLLQKVFPTPRTYHLLPFVLAGAFVLIALLPKGSTALGVVAFGIAGLGCSALLPLTISFSQEQLVTMSSLVAGAMIACYQLGYGIAAFGAGPLQGAGVSLSTIFGVTAVVAFAIGGLSFVLARRQHRVSHLHPRPSPASRLETAG